ncbi:hypothetical protein AB4212_48145 [Streptomyces sp. 2MCAF27]
MFQRPEQRIAAVCRVVEAEVGGGARRGGFRGGLRLDDLWLHDLRGHRGLRGLGDSLRGLGRL